MGEEERFAGSGSEAESESESESGSRGDSRPDLGSGWGWKPEAEGEADAGSELESRSTARSTHGPGSDLENFQGLGSRRVWLDEMDDDLGVWEDSFGEGAASAMPGPRIFGDELEAAIFFASLDPARRGRWWRAARGGLAVALLALAALVALMAWLGFGSSLASEGGGRAVGAVGAVAGDQPERMARETGRELRGGPRDRRGSAPAGFEDLREVDRRLIDEHGVVIVGAALSLEPAEGGTAPATGVVIVSLWTSSPT